MIYPLTVFIAEKIYVYTDQRTLIASTKTPYQAKKLAEELNKIINAKVPDANERSKSITYSDERRGTVIR